jgi:hypothetical protein
MVGTDCGELVNSEKIVVKFSDDETQIKLATHLQIGKGWGRGSSDWYTGVDFKGSGGDMSLRGGEFGGDLVITVNFITTLLKGSPELEGYFGVERGEDSVSLELTKGKVMDV